VRAGAILSDEVSTGSASDRVNLRVKGSPGQSSNGSCNPVATAPGTDLMTGSDSNCRPDPGCGFNRYPP
jgi:hypothetical protein